MNDSRVIRYLRALARWTAAGRPERTPEQIEACLAACRQCPYYVAQNQTCGVCGCSVRQDVSAIRSKLKMATETCPLGRWPDHVEDRGR